MFYRRGKNILQAGKSLYLYIPWRRCSVRIVENEIAVKDLVTKSNLPASDYVINPYVGCPHGCRYCYACFMKRFTRHREEWGRFMALQG